MASRRTTKLLALVVVGGVAGGGLYLGFGPSSPGGSSEVERLRQAGQLTDALELAEQELARRAGDPELLLTVGQLCFEVGDYEEGEKRLQELVAKRDSPAAAWVELARLHEDASRFREASQAAQRALQADPEIAEAHAIVARYELRINRYEEARDRLAPRVAAGKASPEEVLTLGRALLRLGQYAEAARHLERARSPEASDASLLDRLALGEALIGSGEYRPAADWLAGLLEEDPTTASAYYLLGTALARMGLREAATPILKAYNRLRPLDQRYAKIREMERVGMRHRACYERALVNAETKCFGKAVSECLRALSIRPADNEVVLAVATKLIEWEATAEARAVLEKAVENDLEPRSEFLILFAETHRRAGELEEAIGFADRALTRDPQHAGALVLRGRLTLEGGGKPEDAETFLRRARERAPGDWEPLYWLGKVALAQGRVESARTFFQDSHRAGKGTNADLLAGMGQVALRTGATEQAIKLFLEALKKNAETLEALRGLETGMLSLGDAGRAAQARQRTSQAQAIVDAVQQLRASSDPFGTRGDAFLRIARLYRDVAMPYEYIRYLQLARGASPENVTIHRILAESISVPEDTFFAIHALATILRLTPGDSVAQRALALRFARLGVRLDDALRLARESLAAGANPEARYVLTEVLLARGNVEGARREARALLENSPDDPDFQDLVRRVEQSRNKPKSTDGE